jgi:CRISPR-associated protein Csd2
MTAYLNPEYRHDFALLFDVTDGNPNGDPDAGNLPRTDSETSHGLVTDVCLKRKIRNYISTYAEYEASEAEAARLKIFIEHHGVLNDQIRKAYVAEGLSMGKPATDVVRDPAIALILKEIIHLLPSFTLTDGDAEDAPDVVTSLTYSGELSKSELDEQLESIEDQLKANKPLKKFIDDLVKKAGKANKSRESIDKARNWMCREFYDVRMFGAVMSTGLNAGQVRGPIQLTFSRSLDEVQPQDLSITRMAVTDGKDRDKLQTMGRKTLIPYGLYRGYGFYSPCLAAQTGVDKTDLKLFWDALMGMWDLDRSASRGLMALRGLHIFSHENKLGNAPAHTLFDRIKPELNSSVNVPRKFTDYTVTIQEDNLPTGVTLTSLVK